jgi:hypothetical protein
MKLRLKNKKLEEIMKFTLDTKLGTLLDQPQAKNIIEKHIPDVANNPMIGMVKDLSLNTILATPQAAQFGITKEKVEAVLEEINKKIN